MYVIIARKLFFPIFLEGGTPFPSFMPIDADNFTSVLYSSLLVKSIGLISLARGHHTPVTAGTYRFWSTLCAPCTYFVNKIFIRLENGSPCIMNVVRLHHYHGEDYCFCQYYYYYFFSFSLQTKSTGQTWHIYRYGPLVDLSTLTHF